MPDPRPGRLRRVAAELFGERRATNLRAVVCSVPWMRREVLSGVDHPLADLVAASSAVPGLLAPQRVSGHWYVDGGVRSTVSVDLASRARRLLVIAPIAGPMFGPAGRLTDWILRREMATWRSANPTGKLWLIQPDPAIAALACWPGHLFDVDRAKRCFDLARRQGDQLLARWDRDDDGDPAVV